MIPICLILFILFIAVITFAIKRADSAQAKVTEEIWEKERKANSTLRGDTTDLCYITIKQSAVCRWAPSPSASSQTRMASS